MYTPGVVLLWLAFAAGLGSTVAFATAPGQAGDRLRIARQAYWLMTAAVVLASALLMYLILVHDYRLAYVWSYSDSSLPLAYLVSSFWAGQEGSFLLWVLCGVLMGLPLMRLAREYEPRVMLFYNLTLLWLLVLMLRQSPFRFHEGLTAQGVPLDGQGLNPLLQNPWMVIHPPFTFVGYAALAIPFAFALAALTMRRYEDWTRVCLPWVLVALGTLGAALMMGGYWAYETLGWGGYWGWDPVENASLVPWLVTAALVHGMVLQKMTGRFRRLNLVLAVAAHVLVIYATFLTRSGVLSDFSVHSFVDLGITAWLVVDIGFFVVLAIGLVAWRWREIPTQGGEEPFFSRTVFTVLAVLTCLLIALIVVVGTSSPLITRLWGEPSQVGPSFYNQVGVWLAILLGGLLGVTPFLGWRQADQAAGRKIALSAAAAVAITLVGVLLGLHRPLAIVYVAAATTGLVANLWATVDWVRTGRWAAAGGALAHVGVALMLVGFMTTGWLGREQRVSLPQGSPVEALGRTLTFRGVEKPTPAARDAMVVEVADGGGSTTMRPKMWVNAKSNQMVANPDVWSTFTSDLYLAPVEYRPAESRGAGVPLILAKGEPEDYRGWSLTFTGFDLAGRGMGQGAMTVFTPVEVRRPGAEPVVVRPGLEMTADGHLHPIAAALPGPGAGEIRTLRIAVDEGRVQVELVEPTAGRPDSTPPVFVVDVATKPLIAAVWLGTVLVILGTALAVVRRWREGAGELPPTGFAASPAGGLPTAPTS